MKDKIRQFKPWVYQSNRVEDRQDVITNREDFRTGLGQTTTGTMYREEGQGMDKIIEVGQDMILIIEVIMEIIWEVTWGIGNKLIMEVDSGVTSEIKAIKEKGVGHMIGKLGTIEASVTVGQGQVQEGVQIEIGLGVSNVESMHISQDTAQQHKRTER